MKNKFRYAILIILPVILFFLSNIFTDVYTPYYLNLHHDPSYMYLLNSLNLASGHLPGHVEHPGTPLHIFGGIVIKIYYIFAGSNDDIIHDVMMRPEVYLRAIDVSLLMVISITLLLLGILILKIYNNLFAALLMQLTPFFSVNIFNKMSEVNAEHFLIFVVLLLIIVSFRFINDPESESKKLFWFIVLFSIVTGLGMATKINYIPLVFIPLVLIKTVRNKIYFCVISVISFMIFVSPAILNYKSFLNWNKQLFFHSGVYGGGEENIVNTSDYLKNVSTIFFSEKLFSVIYFLIFIFLIIRMLREKKSSDDNNVDFNLKREYNLLAGIFLAMTFQIVIVAKHFVMRYMLPSMMLAIPALFLIIYIVSKTYGLKFRKLNFNYVYVVIIVFIITFEFRKYKIVYEDGLSLRNDSVRLDDFIASEYPCAVEITGHMSFNQEMALYSATPFTGRMNPIYKNFLAQYFPRQLTYKNFTGEFFNLARSTDIKGELDSADKIIFHSNKYNSVDSLTAKIKNDYGFSKVEYNRVYRNANEKDEEAIFELRLYK